MKGSCKGSAPLKEFDSRMSRDSLVPKRTSKNTEDFEKADGVDFDLLRREVSRVWMSLRLRSQERVGIEM